MAPEQSNVRNEASGDEYLLNLAQRLTVFETFAEENIVEWMQVNEQ